MRTPGAEPRHPLFPICTLPPGYVMENGRYEIEVTLDGHPIPADAELLLNDIPADAVVRRGRQHFPLEIGFHAGNLNVSVVRGRRLLASAEINVDPEITKLTRDEYAALISDIARLTLALYRLGGLTVPAEIDPSAVRSDVVTLDLVRSSLDAFERAVTRIADQPVRRLETASARVDTLRARRIEDRAISQALRSGKSRIATAAESQAAPRLVGALGGGWIPQIVERHRFERFDVYENRALAGFLRWLDSSLVLIAERLFHSRSELSPSAAVAWAERIQNWRRRLAVLRRRELFTGLQPDPTLRATSVFRMHPDYAAAFSAMVRMKAGLGTGSAVTPAVPIDRTYALYEIWCYLGLLHAAAETFPLSRPHVAALLQSVPTPNQLGAVLATGAPSTIVLTDTLTLSYQRRFSPAPDASGCRTGLIEAVPDITIARTDTTGRCTGLVVLDPKYRRGSALMDGVRDLHVYRDAIVGAENDRLVAAAIAIAPRSFGAGAAEIPAIPAAPGVATARPGHDPAIFGHLLNTAVQRLT